MDIDLSKHKLALTYPCLWDYKLIGKDEAALRRAIHQVMGGLDHTVSFSNASRTGKYCSLKVELTVQSEQQRTDLYLAFKASRDIILVL